MYTGAEKVYANALLSTILLITITIVILKNTISFYKNWKLFQQKTNAKKTICNFQHVTIAKTVDKRDILKIEENFKNMAKNHVKILVLHFTSSISRGMLIILCILKY